MSMNAFERFPDHELSELREELLRAGLDSFQTGELLKAYLVQHGYGVSTDEARDAAARIETGCTLPRLQEELEKLASFM